MTRTQKVSNNNVGSKIGCSYREAALPEFERGSVVMKELKVFCKRGRHSVGVFVEFSVFFRITNANCHLTLERTRAMGSWNMPSAIHWLKSMWMKN